MIEALAPFPILAPDPPVPAPVNGLNRSADVGIKRILVGSDCTAPAIASLAWATVLAERTGAEIILANVLDSDLAGFSVDASNAHAIDVEGHLLSDWSAPVRASNVPWSTLVLKGDPDALLAAADREDVDLVVVGTRSHGRIHIGGLAHHLAHLARRPLAIIPERSAHDSIDQVVVGVDGSDGSSAATQWTAGLASQTGSQVSAVFVFEPLAERVPESYSRSWRPAAQERLDTEWTAPLHTAGLLVKTSIIEDFHPVTALTMAAENVGAGLIVVGASRVGAILGPRLGGVPVQLVLHAQIPVVLVPPPSAPQPPGDSVVAVGGEGAPHATIKRFGPDEEPLGWTIPARSPAQQ